MYCSIFKSIQTQTAEKYLPLEDIVYAIRTGELNAPGDLIGVDKLKRPVATFSAWFQPDHKARKISEENWQTNNLACLDFDKLTPEALEGLKQVVDADPFTLCYFISPSQKGLKLIVRIKGITRENFKAVYSGLLSHYRELTGIEADRSCSDPVRCCFLPYDPKIHLNLQAQPLDLTEIIGKGAVSIATPKGTISNPTLTTDTELQPRSTTLSDELQRVRVLLGDCQRQHVSLTSTYADWFAVGCALNRAFGAEVGGQLFHEFSRLDTTIYDEGGCETQWNKIVDSQDSQDGVTLATLFALAKDKGIGIPPRPKVKPEIEAPSTRTQTANRIMIKSYLAEHHKIFYDTGQDVLYLSDPEDGADPEKWKVLTERSADLNALLLQMEQQGVKALKTPLWEVINNPNTYEKVNVLGLTLDKLAAEWDGKDYLTALVETVDVGEEDRALWASTLPKWLVSVVAQAMGSEGAYQFRNEFVLTLTGGQGLGKSGFFQNLLFDDKYYHDGTSFDFNNKNHLIYLGTKMLICLEEMQAQSKHDADLLKGTLSLHKIGIDRKYKDERDYRRIGSFCGCTNHQDFLKDGTGNRRFLVFEMVSPLAFDAYNGIEKRQLWGQLVSMYKKGFAYTISQQDKDEIVARNLRRYTMSTQEDYFIQSELLVTGDPEDYITNFDLNTAMLNYQSAKRGNTHRMTERDVKNRLKLLGCDIGKTKKVAGKTQRVITGVELRDPDPNNLLGITSSVPLQKLGNVHFN